MPRLTQLRDVTHDVKSSPLEKMKWLCSKVPTKIKYHGREKGAI